MIVKNEAARIRDCLESVEGWVDEMVIVDTGSEDETIAIAQSFHPKLYQFDWCDDFAAARNFSLQWVESDWVLVLDADEVFLPEAIPALDEAMRSPDTLLITLLREEVGAKQGPVSLVSRLFRNHPGLQFKRPYHELVDDSVAEIQAQEPRWKVESLSISAIRHFGYQQAVVNQKAKAQRAQLLLEKGIQQYPEDAYLYSKLGGLQWDLQEYETAQKTLEQGLSLIADEPAVAYELHYHLGLVYGAQGAVKQSEAAYQQAIAQSYPDLLKIGAYLNLGSLYLDYGALEAALTLFRHGVEVSPQLAIAHYNLGLAHKTLQQYPEAIAAYEQAIALNPDYAAAYQNLGVVYFKIGKMKECRERFEKAIALYEQSNPELAVQLYQGVKELGILS
jgi:tetratricopeptide (TPR) repeat protein